ncbi:hypothetical protein [Vibrio sp. 10N.261.46.A3]|uniref:hypothetical protein n=1 Tax=Vibrio sp. 10N.261.46.A3 TaxID=3229658 RepID=UPI00354E6E11
MLRRIVAFSLFFFSLFVSAEDATVVRIKQNVNSQLDVEANFTRLSPQAIELGLRDLTLLGRVKDPKKPKSQKNDIEWYAISKSFNGTEKAKSLSNPLITDLNGEKISGGSEVVASGDLDAMLAAFSDMLNEQVVHSEESTEIAMEEAAETSPLSSGSMSSSSPQRESADINEEDFSVETDKYTVSYELCEPIIDGDFIATEMERSVKTSTVTNEIIEQGQCQPTGKTYPTYIEETQFCDMFYDYDEMKAIEMTKTVKLDKDTNEELSSTSCDFSNVSYPIQKDFNASCDNFNSYTDQKIYFGYREYIDKEGVGGDKEYISACKLDMNNPKPLFSEVEECTATENLIDNVATINKRWYYVDDQSLEHEYITDCIATEEEYPIQETEITCSPYIDEYSGAVLTQTRKGWQDANGNWHYATECRASADSSEVPVQKDFSGELEHDFVGGVSYEMSRDYYVHNGERVYLTNSYSRDPSVSYPHQLTEEGCTLTHDDANLRSRISQKTYINRKGQLEIIKGCEASSSYVPYGPEVIVTTPNNFIDGQNVYGAYYVSNPTGGYPYPAEEGCKEAKEYHPQARWDKVTGTMSYFDIFDGRRSMNTVAIFYRETTTRTRYDSSIYTVSSKDVCESAYERP